MVEATKVNFRQQGWAMTAALWQQWHCGAATVLHCCSVSNSCQQSSPKNSRKNNATNQLGQKIQCQEQ